MPIVYAGTRELELVLHGKLYITCIVYLAVREMEYYTEILRNIPRMREQWCPGHCVFPPPQKTAWERGNLVPRPSHAPARKRDLSQDFLALLNQHDDVFYVIQNACSVRADSNASIYTWQLELSGVPVRIEVT